MVLSTQFRQKSNTARVTFVWVLSSVKILAKLGENRHLTQFFSRNDPNLDCQLTA